MVCLRKLGEEHDIVCLDYIRLGSTLINSQRAGINMPLLLLLEYGFQHIFHSVLW